MPIAGSTLSSCLIMTIVEGVEGVVLRVGGVIVVVVGIIVVVVISRVRRGGGNRNLDLVGAVVTEAVVDGEVVMEVFVPLALAATAGEPRRTLLGGGVGKGRRRGVVARGVVLVVVVVMVVIVVVVSVIPPCRLDRRGVVVRVGVGVDGVIMVVILLPGVVPL